MSMDTIRAIFAASAEEFAAKAKFEAACAKIEEYCRTAKARQYRRNRAAQIRRREGAGA